MYRKLLIACLILSVNLLAVPVALGTTFVSECADANYRQQQADLVVAVTLADGQETEVVEEIGNVYSLVPLTVTAVEKGEAPAQLKLKQPGGELPDGNVVDASGLSLDWPDGINWRLYLIVNSDETYSLLCGEMGRQSLDETGQVEPVITSFEKDLQEVYSQLLTGGPDRSDFSRFLLLFLVLSIWSVIWKGVALWQAAQRKQKAWFIAILILNTLGILEILYLLFWRKKKE